MDVEFRNDELRFYFVPEDDRGAIYVFVNSTP